MKNLEARIKKYLLERGWGALKPSDIAKSISIESAELLELFQWENLALEEVIKNKKKLAEIESELADVLIYCIDMSVLLGLDTEKLVLNKLAKVEKKYPAKLMQKGAKSGAGSDTDKLYWKIKELHRRKK